MPWCTIGCREADGKPYNSHCRPQPDSTSFVDQRSSIDYQWGGRDLVIVRKPKSLLIMLSAKYMNVNPVLDCSLLPSVDFVAAL